MTSIREDGVHFRVTSCEIRGERSGNKVGVIPITLLFIISPLMHTHLSLPCLVCDQAGSALTHRRSIS
jgi:hypothetical protein